MSEVNEELEQQLEEQAEQEMQRSITSSAALMSVLVVVSRITGFARTWVQAYAMGATVLASCYEVANNLPTQIYELVTAGMLVTAFLPVYVSVKRSLGRKGANEYVSNLTSIVVLLTGAVTLLSFIFAAQIIWSQSFSAAEDFDSARAVWFFRFFVIEIVLYALSTIFQGVVNAERDYLWTFLAPIFNNVVVMASFLSYAFLANSNPTLGLLILAIGNPLGVLVQVLLQLPSMRSHGVILHWKVDFSDPALRDTVKIGVPSIVVMVMGFVTNAFQMNALLSFTAIGGSIGTYALLWYNLPYAVFAVPLTTVLFTELSDYYASEDMESFKGMVVTGTSKLAFALVPFAIYLIVFSPQLVTLISSGHFEESAATMCALYLAWRAPSLPFYGIGMYLQKVCSATRKMTLYAGASVVCGVIQVLLLLLVAPSAGLWMVPFTSCVFYIVFDAIVLVALQHSYGHMGMRSMFLGCFRSLVFGLAGGLVAILIIRYVGPIIPTGEVMKALLLCIIAGVPALLVTYGTAALLKVPEASTVTTVVGRLRGRS